MKVFDLQTGFRRLLKLIPNIVSEDYWLLMVNENHIEQITLIIEVLENVSTNSDRSVTDPDLLWILASVTKHIGYYVYGHLTADLDEAVVRITRNEIQVNKIVASFVYYCGAFRADHKQSLIHEIVKSCNAEYVIDEYVKLFYSELNEYNYWLLIDVLYDFRSVPEILATYEENFWIASDYIEEENVLFEGRNDIRYQYLINMYLTGKEFVLLPE